MKKIHYLEMSTQPVVSRQALLNQSDIENTAMAAAKLLVSNFSIELNVGGGKYVFSDIAWYPETRKLSLRMGNQNGNVLWVALEEHVNGKVIAQAIRDMYEERNNTAWLDRLEDAQERGFQNTWAKA